MWLYTSCGHGHQFSEQHDLQDTLVPKWKHDLQGPAKLRYKYHHDLGKLVLTNFKNDSFFFYF